MSHLIIRSIQHRRALLSHQKMGISESSLPCMSCATVWPFRSLFWWWGGLLSLAKEWGKKSEEGPCCSALLGENPFSFNLRRGAGEELERPKG